MVKRTAVMVFIGLMSFGTAGFADEGKDESGKESNDTKNARTTTARVSRTGANRVTRDATVAAAATLTSISMATPAFRTVTCRLPASAAFGTQTGRPVISLRRSSAVRRAARLNLVAG